MKKSIFCHCGSDAICIDNKGICLPVRSLGGKVDTLSERNKKNKPVVSELMINLYYF